MTGLRSSSAIAGCVDASAPTRMTRSRSESRSACVAAAVAVEQREGLEAAEHAVGLARAERGEPDLDVAEQLDRHAAGAAGDERPEGRVADGADDQLGARRGHPLDVEALDGRARCRELRRHLAAARVTAVGPSSPRRTAPASLLCTRPGAMALSATGPPSSAAARPAALRGRARSGSPPAGCPSSAAGARRRRAPASRRPPPAPRPRSSPPWRCRRRRRRARTAGPAAPRGGGRAGRRARARAPPPRGSRSPAPRRCPRPPGVSAPSQTASTGRSAPSAAAAMPRATSAARAASGRTKIVTTASTASSPSRMRSERSYCSAVAEAIMSTGLAVEASAGRIVREPRARGVGERLDPQPRGFAGVRAQDRRSAGVGQDRHAVARRQRLAREQPGDVEHLPDRLGAQHPGAREQRVDGHVGGREQRAGVGGRGAMAGGRAAALDRHDRLVAW